MLHTIPEEEVKRIEAVANNYADCSHEYYATTHNASAISYFAGAKAEYIASLERQSEFIQWLDIEIAGVKMCYEDIHNSTNANSAYGLVLQYLKETRQKLLITYNQSLI